jgi:DNA-binding PadR family transcriptional regulator
MCPRKITPLSLEYILLGLLQGNPAHGYELHKRIRDLNGSGLLWDIKISLLYSILDRLESDGLITSKNVQSESRLPRKEFSLTGMGTQVLYSWSRSPVDHIQEIHREFQARLYFSMQESQESTRKLLLDQIEVCLEWLLEEQNELSNIREDSIYSGMIHSYRIMQIDTVIHWLENCLEVTG